MHCTVTTAIRPAHGPSAGIVIREHFTTHTTRTDSGQTQQNYCPKDIFLIVPIALGLITVY